MKKILLGTSAIAGIALFAQAAQAQITVTLGGYTEFFGALYDDDVPTAPGAGRTEYEFQLETEIVVRADGKADNGLLYGAKVEFQNTGAASSPGIITDEASLYLGGTWGRLEFGDFDGAADTLKIYAPLIGIEQIDGDAYDFLRVPSVALDRQNLPLGFAGAAFGAQPTFGIFTPDSGDSTKVMYLTPRFAGFQAGASFAPSVQSEGQLVVGFENQVPYSDFWEAGINYAGEFAGFGVAASATASGASGRSATLTVPGTEDFLAWGLGAQVKYAGFALGGGWVDADDFGRPTTGPLTPAAGTFGDQGVWHIGASYTAGPLAVGVSYMDAEGFKAAPTAGDPVPTYADDYKSYGVGVAYTLAPGFIVQSDLMWVDEDIRFNAGTAAAPVLTTASNEGWVWVLGTRLNF